MTAVIEVEGLRKQYRRLRRGRRHTTVAVDGLDLEVPEGGVYGFLGPNGSGKTTTIRCLLGLVRPSAGACRVFGADTRTSLSSVLDRVGSIVETPALFPTMSGRRNLELLGAMIGRSKRAAADVLETVGLAERADDHVRTYSLGMRQRLGLAAALLKDPALLVLDEPANGLDPAGIRETRELLRRLGDEGRTVFVSSHLLSEVQHTCDRVAILSRGRCVAQGAVDDVLRAGRHRGLLVRVADLNAGIGVLRDAGIDAELNREVIHVRAEPSSAAQVSETLGRAGLWVTELRAEEISLEDVFLEITGSPMGRDTQDAEGDA